MIFAAVTIVHMEKHFKILKAASLIVKENTRISIQDTIQKSPGKLVLLGII